MDDLPRVAVIILNWNNYTDTSNCLQSLKQVSYGNMQVIVVDNGSTDGSGTQLAEDFGWCHFVFNDENLGFAGGCNTGIERALENEADYVLLLNNDITVSPNFLQPLVNTAENHERVAAVGGVIYEEDTGKIWDAGGKMRPYLANISRDKEVKSSEEYQTEFVTCAQCLLSRDFLNDHRLDENFFFGVEEIDLSWQALADDWRLYINPDSKVYHDVGSSTEHLFTGRELFSSFQKYHNTRGRLYFAHKNLRSHHKIVYWMLALSLYPLFYTYLGLRYDRIDILFSHFLAIRDYLNNENLRKPEDFNNV